MHLQSGLAHVLAARKDKAKRGERRRNKGRAHVIQLQLFLERDRMRVGEEGVG